MSSTQRVDQRISTGAVMTSVDQEPIMKDVARLDGTLNIEGFDTIPYESWLEQPATYEAAEEATRQRLSTAAQHNQYGGFWFTRTRPSGSPAFDPGYRYVLSRLGGLDSGRRVIARHGPLVLARRVVPFDVTVARGVAVDDRRRDPGGSVWIQKPDNAVALDKGALQLWVSATDRRRAYVRAIFTAPPDVRVTAPGARQRRLPDGRLAACLAVASTAALRIVDLPTSPEPQEMGPSPSPPYDPVPVPAKEIRLDAVSASTKPCSVRGSGAP